MSVQTAGQKWHCPGTSSQDWLSGCQREEVRERERGWGWGAAVSQVVLPVDRLPGWCWWWWGFISYCQPKLVFPEQKCQLVWHLFCFPLFPTHISTSQQVISLFLPMECKTMCTGLVLSMAAEAIST